MAKYLQGSENIPIIETGDNISFDLSVPLKQKLSEIELLKTKVTNLENKSNSMVCKLKLSDNEEHGNSTNNRINMGIYYNSDDTIFSTSTTGEIKVLKTGFYRITTQIKFNANSGGVNIQTRLYEGSKSVYNEERPSYGGIIVRTITDVEYLSANDTIKVHLGNWSGYSVTVYADYTYLIAEKI